MITFTEHTTTNTEGDTKKLLQSIESGYGFIPNLFSFMAEAPTTVQAYMQLNDLLAKTSIPMPQLQVALLAASIENDCEFCRVAHRAIGKKMGANVESLAALNEGREITEPKDKAIAEFTKAIVHHRGWVPEQETAKFLEAGYNKQNILEVVLVVTIKTLSNYSNHFTKPEANPELIAML